MSGIGLVALLAVLAFAPPILFVALTYTRRRLIACGADVAVCGLRHEPDARWRVGLLRLSPHSLQWYPLLGWTARTGHSWIRRSIDLGTPQPMERETALSSVLTNAVRVSIRGLTPAGKTAPAELGMTPAHYTTLRAWVEASPPSGWPVLA